MGAVHKLQDADQGWGKCHPANPKEVSLNLPAMGHCYQASSGPDLTLTHLSSLMP
uniref:Uncharacterized protein n=1 Tax=Anguilla anguilla TaxID=7936 RepID=A0A0E9RAX7_ANGAN